MRTSALQVPCVKKGSSHSNIGWSISGGFNSMLTPYILKDPELFQIVNALLAPDEPQGPPYMRVGSDTRDDENL